MKELRNLFKDMDKILLITSVILFVFGLLNIVTASSRAAVVNYNTSLYSYFFKQLFSLILGLILSFIIITKSTKKYSFWGTVAYVVVLGLLIYVKMFVQPHNGSQNWIRIPGFGTMQPSEFSKPVLIVVISLLFEKFYKKLKNPNISHYDMIGIILIVGLIFPAIIFIEKDLGTAIIIVVIFGVLFITSPILKQEKLKIIGLGIILMFIACSYLMAKTGSLLTPAQMSRFDFFNPCEDYYDGGYQICNGFIAINDGSLLGVGIGNSKQVSYIPESHTDSVFAIIAEEYGLIICTFIFIAYFIILLRILKLSSRTNMIKGKYICLGVAVYIFLHFFINLGGLFGIMPLTGVPLPFLSYGGSYTLSLVVSLAIVQKIHIETEREKIKV